MSAKHPKTHPKIHPKAIEKALRIDAKINPYTACKKQQKNSQSGPWILK